MPWDVEFHDDFIAEFENLPDEVQNELYALVKALQIFGPQLGRPRVDTLNGSKHINMKELRFNAASGVWRFAFAFDPNRQAVILCGSDKAGVGEKRFYQRLIAKADARFDAHCVRIKREQAT